MVYKHMEIYNNSRAPVGLAVAAILAWMVRVDNRVTNEEHNRWSAFATPLLSSIHEAELLNSVLKDNDTGAIEAACRIVRRHADANQKSLLLDLLIGMMLADQRIAETERYILDFIADLLLYSNNDVEARFTSITGSKLPPRSNYVDPRWWMNQYKRSSGNHRPDQPPINEKRMKAYATLGLEQGASPEEIRAAFKRLAMMHHPDRFQQLGESAVNAATETFRRIRDAYEVLSS